MDSFGKLDSLVDDILMSHEENDASKNDGSPLNKINSVNEPTAQSTSEVQEHPKSDPEPCTKGLPVSPDEEEQPVKAVQSKTIETNDTIIIESQPTSSSKPIETKSNIEPTAVSTKKPPPNELTTMIRRQVANRLEKIQNNWLLSSDLARKLADRVKGSDAQIKMLDKQYGVNGKILKLLSEKSERLEHQVRQVQTDDIVGRIYLQKVYPDGRSPTNVSEDGDMKDLVGDKVKGDEQKPPSYENVSQSAAEKAQAIPAASQPSLQVNSVNSANPQHNPEQPDTDKKLYHKLTSMVHQPSSELEASTGPKVFPPKNLPFDELYNNKKTPTSSSGPTNIPTQPIHSSQQNQASRAPTTQVSPHQQQANRNSNPNLHYYQNQQHQLSHFQGQMAYSQAQAQQYNAMMQANRAAAVHQAATQQHPTQQQQQLYQQYTAYQQQQARQKQEEMARWQALQNSEMNRKVGGIKRAMNTAYANTAHAAANMAKRTALTQSTNTAYQAAFQANQNWQRQQKSTSTVHQPTNTPHTAPPVHDFSSCIEKFDSKFDATTKASDGQQAKQRFKLSWSIRANELEIFKRRQGNYKYYIIHNGKEADKLELKMEVAFAKKFHADTNLFSVSLSGAPMTQQAFSRFKIELFDVSKKQCIATRETTCVIKK